MSTRFDTHDLPFITVITPFRNGVKFARAYVNSLQCQTFSNFYCILVNDHSTDNSAELLASLTDNDSRFLIVNNPTTNSFGPASARNYGISLASSTLIAFCDIDDTWSSTKLYEQLTYHCHHSLDLSVTHYRKSFIDCSSTLKTVKPPHNVSYSSLLRRNDIPMLTVIVKRDLLIPFASCRHEDYLLWLELFADKPIRYGCLPKLLATYNVHDSNLTKNRLLMVFWTFGVFKRHTRSFIASSILTIRWLFFQLILLFLR